MITVITNAVYHRHRQRSFVLFELCRFLAIVHTQHIYFEFLPLSDQWFRPSVCVCVCVLGQYGPANEGRTQKKKRFFVHFFVCVFVFHNVFSIFIALFRLIHIFLRNISDNGGKWRAQKEYTQQQKKKHIPKRCLIVWRMFSMYYDHFWRPLSAGWWQSVGTVDFFQFSYEYLMNDFVILQICMSMTCNKIGTNITVMMASQNIDLSSKFNDFS